MCFQNLQVENTMVDMPMEMQQYVLHCTKMALQWHKGDNMNIALYIKNEFDTKYGHYWHCVVSDHTFAGSFSK
jgi:hypothetical protein